MFLQNTPKTKIGFLPFKQYSASAVIQKPDAVAVIQKHEAAAVIQKQDGTIIHVHNTMIHQSVHHVHAVIHQPAAVVHQPAAVVHQPAAVVHQPAAVVHQPVHHNSAGIIIIEDKFYDKHGASYQTILLGYNARSNQYELFYGKRDATDASSMKTAQRECSEETSNMFRFSSGVISRSQCVYSPNKKHHAFVVRVQPPPHGIKRRVFKQNHAILKLGRAPRCWTELAGITRIGIKEAISSGILDSPAGRQFSMFDVYGDAITIFCRDADFIRDAIKSKLNLSSPIYPLRFIKTYDDKFDGNRNRFLNGTSCYMA